MIDSVFAKIIHGTLPAYKIYEDEKTFAFLDIHPVQEGHVLVVPKVQVDRLEALSMEDYMALWVTVQKVMRRLTAVFGETYRACLKVEGFDVPHVHVHIIPCRSSADFWAKPMSNEPDHAHLAMIAQKLVFA